MVMGDGQNTPGILRTTAGDVMLPTSVVCPRPAGFRNCALSVPLIFSGPTGCARGTLGSRSGSAGCGAGEVFEFFEESVRPYPVTRPGSPWVGCVAVCVGEGAGAGLGGEAGRS